MKPKRTAAPPIAMPAMGPGAKVGEDCGGAADEMAGAAEDCVGVCVTVAVCCVVCVPVGEELIDAVPPPPSADPFGCKLVYASQSATGAANGQLSF